MDWSDEAKCAAVKTCAELGVCARCCLRIQGSRDYVKYRNPDLDREHQPGDTACPLCLGALEHIGAIINAVVSHVRDSGYDISSFTLSITLLPVMTLRHCSLLLHLAHLQGLPDGTALETLGVEPVDVKEAMKWALGDRLRAALGVDFEFKADFVVSLTFEHAASLKEIECLERTDPDGPVAQRWRGLQHNSRKGIHVHSDSLQTAAKLCPLVTRADLLRAEAAGDGPGCPPRRAAGPCASVVSCGHDPIFISGIYHKFARGLSQSPWIINGVRKSELSVQEVLAGPILAAYGCSNYRFSTAGREDVDVRMLGTGRPFVLQLVDARRTRLDEPRLRALEAAVNGVQGAAALARAAGFGPEVVALAEAAPSGPNAGGELVEIRGLCRLPSDPAVRMKAVEETKRKTYRCVVMAAGPVSDEGLARANAVKDLVVQQRTPIRVLHRRSLATRPKVVHAVRASRLNARWLLVDVEAQGGTYIKEFVHSDRGRTRPSLGSLLGTPADIVQLDVVGIEGVENVGG